MSRTIVLCRVGVADGEVCSAPATYRIEARSASGKRYTLTLCSEHIHRCWHLAQTMLERRYPQEQKERIKVRSIHLHQLNHAPKAEAAAVKIG